MIHKVFISYHHKNDQPYKDALVEYGASNSIFMDKSVDTGDISDDLSDESIRQKIRDEYLRDSTVTIVLVGEETRKRKHVDWEIYSSMYDGKVNSKSGIVVINLSELDDVVIAPHDGEKMEVYPLIHSWRGVEGRQEYEDMYPYMPDRIIDNLLYEGAKISVTSWKRVADNPAILKKLIELAYRDRSQCKYYLRRPMRRQNS